MTRYEINKKWRKNHPEIWGKGKQRYYNQFNNNNAQRREKWTAGDINLIIEKETSDRNLSKLLGRSVLAIQVKRSSLKNGR